MKIKNCSDFNFEEKMQLEMQLRFGALNRDRVSKQTRSISCLSLNKINGATWKGIAYLGQTLKKYQALV